MSSFTFQQSTDLELAKSRLAQLDSQDDRLDRKAQNNIQAVTIILAIAVAFGLVKPSADNFSQGMLALTFLAYGLSVGFSYYVTLPKRWFHPHQVNIATQKTDPQYDQNYYSELVKIYEEAILANDSVLFLKARALYVSTLLMVFSIALIILLAARGANPT